MDYLIETDDKLQAVKVKATGQLTQETRKGILSSVKDHVHAFRLSRVLIDLTESSFHPNELMTGAVELVNHMKTIGIPVHVRFAFIYREQEAIYHRQLYTDLAQIHGWNLRYFTNYQEAAVWLTL